MEHILASLTLSPASVARAEEERIRTFRALHIQDRFFSPILHLGGQGNSVHIQHCGEGQDDDNPEGLSQ
jgi:hypothetical protein